jgi:hypothetical protein
MNEAEQNLIDLMCVLNKDVDKAIEMLNSGADFDFNSRTFLRAYASWVEGTLWMAKELVRHLEKQWHRDLPLEYQLYIFDQDWTIKGSGMPSLQEKRLKTKENLKALFRLAEYIDTSFSIDFTCKEWSNVTHFYELRDRMMHPKQLASLKVSKDDIARCENGRLWLFKQFSMAMSAFVEK